jgi:hypothetical protein
MYNFEPDGWWHSLHYNEWITLKMITGSAIFFLHQATEIEVALACAASDLEYESERFWWFVATYGMTKLKQELPPPLDVIWLLDPDIWDAVNTVVLEEPDPDFCLSLFFAFPGNQGGAWPVCWP